MAKTDIWMPLYIGDYLADTARLTTEQHGAYLLLLMDYWRSGKLPDNDVILAQICKLSPDAWSNAKAMLIPFFCIEDGFWVHKRVENELKLSAQNKAKKHDRAVKAAQSRWNHATSNATSNAQAMLNECPSPSPSPSHIKPIKTYASKVATPDGVSESVWQDFLTLRAGKKAKVTETAIKGIAREANKAGVSLEQALQVCCERGWTGFKADWVANASSKQTMTTTQAQNLAASRAIFGDERIFENEQRTIDINATKQIT